MQGNFLVGLPEQTVTSIWIVPVRRRTVRGACFLGIPSVGGSWGAALPR